MKLTIITCFIIILVLILIKYNSNNLSFMTGKVEVENFFQAPPNFICKKDELACILSYQKYNKECKNSFGDWKKFQDLNHNRKINGKTLKVLAVDSTKHPNLSMVGNFDGPRVSLVSRYQISNYDGRLNLKNLEQFLNKNI
jgi:hypothetical protein